MNKILELYDKFRALISPICPHKWKDMDRFNRQCIICGTRQKLLSRFTTKEYWKTIP